jgi:hypothetical protein
VRHIAPGTSTKGEALKTTIRQQFKASKNLKDETQIELLKSNAVRGLSNYMLYQSATKDTQLSSAMKQQQNDILKNEKIRRKQQQQHITEQDKKQKPS